VLDEELKRVAKTVALQRTGDKDRWDEFLPLVREAYEVASQHPTITPRDILDIGDSQD